MAGRGEEIAARARRLIGVRFRPQGRDPQLGLDCVGVAALSVSVPIELVRRDYALRGQQLAELEHELCDMGFHPVAEHEIETGDIIVFQAGPAQIHIAVRTGSGFVHADAGLRTVVERPLPLPWPMLSAWRVAEDV